MPEINAIEAFITAKFEPAATKVDADIIIGTLDLKQKLAHIFPGVEADVYQILTDNEFLMTETTKMINPKWMLKLK